MFLSIFYFFLFCTRVKAQGASLFPWSSVVQRHVSALMLIQGRPSDLRISTGRGPLGPLLFSCGVPHVGVIVGCLLALGNIRCQTQWRKAIIPHACIPCSKTSKKYGAYWTLKYAAGPGTVCMRRVCVCVCVYVRVRGRLLHQVDIAVRVVKETWDDLFFVAMHLCRLNLSTHLQPPGSNRLCH